ncbi:hypothetical protein [Photobacterium leiognathi]|uniref:hypothetical protein n=1 Tax=Photobacterium leiognathi TaxID=553611 RepID=UPI002981743E|nr:hypothetical protein [Photobacterium leiognathi]
MYKDVDTVIKNIKTYFDSRFGEKFTVRKDFRYIDFTSHNYNFCVYAAFLQARIPDDHNVPIEERISKALEIVTIEKGAKYEFTTVYVNEPLPLKYVVELVK